VLPSSAAERLARLAPDQREAATAAPGPVLCVAPAGSGKTTTLVARVAWLVATGALDFDDLVARALRLLEARPPLLRRWRAKCEHLLVDEMQDVDRTQLRLALLLVAPANRIFGVGDDDQTSS
jgi:superfamily I DNA/RNA helicase